MKETVFGPHSENTVLFMNGSGWKQQSWTLGGTHCPLVFRGKSQVSVRSLHPSLCGGRRGVVKGPDREQGSGERVSELFLWQQMAIHLISPKHTMTR